MVKIDATYCTACHRCIKVCPSVIFSVSDNEVSINNESDCIRCGHCIAACGSNAIAHDCFPTEKVHAIDFSLCPTPDQMLALIRKRRSNRAFSTKPVPEGYFAQILEAAYRAPTASNMQQVQFTLVTDPKKLKIITGFTLNTFYSTVRKVDNFVVRPVFKRFFPALYGYLPKFKRLFTEFNEQGKDSGILRGATAVLLIHSPKTSGFVHEDCQLAYQNASLMAECLGVSQFYTGFVLRAVKQKKGKLEELLGVRGKIFAGMAMGMPLFAYPNYVDRKDIVQTLQAATKELSKQ